MAINKYENYYNNNYVSLTGVSRYKFEADYEVSSGFGHLALETKISTNGTYCDNTLTIQLSLDQMRAIADALNAEIEAYDEGAALAAFDAARDLEEGGE